MVLATSHSCHKLEGYEKCYKKDRTHLKKVEERRQKIIVAISTARVLIEHQTKVRYGLITRGISPLTTRDIGIIVRTTKYKMYRFRLL